MTLLGARAWHIPKWLDRVIPDIDIGGSEHLAKLGPAAAATLEERLPSSRRASQARSTG